MRGMAAEEFADGSANEGAESGRSAATQAGGVRERGVLRTKRAHNSDGSSNAAASGLWKTAPPVMRRILRGGVTMMRVPCCCFSAMLCRIEGRGESYCSRLFPTLSRAW